MSYANPNPHVNSFNRFVGFSVFAHIAVVAVFAVKTAFFPAEDIIIPQAIRVDVVALPDKPATPQPKPQPKAPPKVKVKKPDPPKPKPKPKAKPKPKPDKLKNTLSEQKKALEKLKAMQAIQQVEQQLKNKAENAPPKEKVYKGNVANAGDSLTGLSKIKFNEYFQRVKSHVSDHWDLPQWLANANLKAQALVLLDERGYVIRKELVLSSGNDVFDSKVLNALEQASPFPAPPGRLRNVIGLQGMVLNFPE